MVNCTIVQSSDYVSNKIIEKNGEIYDLISRFRGNWTRSGKLILVINCL